MPASRYDASRDDLVAILAGAPAYRVDQAWTGLYEQLTEPHEWSNLPKAMRAELAEQLPPALELVTESVSDSGDTVKMLWRLTDGSRIETVLMLYRDRATVCISSQAGCAMACGFCATGQAGFTRHLTPGEIVEQVVRATQRARAGGRRVSNVVLMGMGEPLANEGAMWTAIERLHGDLGLSARHITVSTVGIVPGIRKLAARPLPVNLAVSLHAANDTLRDELVPINRRYPIADLLAACRDYLAVKRRRVSFEWAMIDGVLMRDTMGEPVHYLLQVQDETERRRADDLALRVAIATRVAEAEEHERRRVSQELHDRVGQELTALGISLGILRRQ